MGQTTHLVNPQAWLDRMLAERDKATIPQRRAMIARVYEHLEAEFNNRLDDTMATLVPDAHFRGWCGAPNGPNGEPLITTRAQIREGYRRPMEDKGGFPPTELVLEHFLVSDDGVAMDGVLKRLVTGQSLSRPEFKPDLRYLAVSRLGLLIPFRNGLMVGEDMYWDLRIDITPIDA